MSAALPRSRATARPWGMSAALPRSSVTAGIEDDARHRGPWSRRTFPPRCRGRAPLRGTLTATYPDQDLAIVRRVCRGSSVTAGIEADEHVRRAAEVERHRGD